MISQLQRVQEQVEAKGNPFYNRPDEWAYYLPLHGNSMLELGNKKNGDLTYKAWFEHEGFRHVSVDWNGQDGALKLDLRTPLWLELGQFDMVTNIGTSEHVSDQDGVWRNIHHLTEIGGVYVGQCPYHDGRNWWWHGEHYPTEQFYRSFAELNGWVIERMGVDRPEPYKNLYVRMRRFEYRRFTMPELSLIKYNKQQSRHPAPAGCVEPS
jgi:SAM-dependent methyltransferase